MMQLKTMSFLQDPATEQALTDRVAVVHKSRSLGCSWIAPVEPSHELRHLLLYLPEFTCSARGKRYEAVLVGEITRVLYFKGPVREEQKLSHIDVFHKRLSDVIDLSSTVRALRIGQECDGASVNGARRQVMEFARRVAPDSMELCLDKNAWNLPDRPAIELFAAVGGDMLWDDSEAFKRWLVGQWLGHDAHGRRR
ncbi:hypothetical protein EHZ19_18690 [Paraburkholderia bannensis]|nr:hypothetical protein [Paraburkholderia bannensis]RQM46544.1 hypothetical protein EHZ19_18690 [Paraburkholderia bannensis]